MTRMLNFAYLLHFAASGRAKRQNRQILPNFGKAYRSYSTSTTRKSDTTVTKRSSPTPYAYTAYAYEGRD